MSDENDMRRAELDRIADFLVEDILASPDDEISSEAVDDNDDVARLAAEMTSLFPSRVFGENVIAFPILPLHEGIVIEAIVVKGPYVEPSGSSEPGRSALGHPGVTPVPQMPVSQMPASQVTAGPPVPPAFAHHAVHAVAVKPPGAPDRQEPHGFFRKISILFAAAVAPAFVAMHFYSALLNHLGLDDDDDDDDSHEPT